MAMTKEEKKKMYLDKAVEYCNSVLEKMRVSGCLLVVMDEDTGQYSHTCWAGDIKKLHAAVLDAKDKDGLVELCLSQL